MMLQIGLFIFGIVLTTLLGVLAWVGNNMNTHLKSISISVQRMEIDLGILNSDHHNLKSTVKNLEEDFKELKNKPKPQTRKR